MTFQPVLPPIMLLVIGLALIVFRLITMYQLHAAAGASWTTVWRWCGLTLAMLLVLIAAARPGLPTGSQQASASAPSGQNINAFFVVDRSPDSGITDYADIRADIAELINRYPHARFAVIAFAAHASVDWPLSEDVWSLQPTVARLAPYAAQGDEQQSDAAAAANVLRYQLIAAGQQYRDSTNLVFYFGSGANGSQAPQGDFEPAAGTVDGGAVFGYGTSPDEARLELIADQLGVPYARRQPGEPLPQIAVKPNSAGTQPTISIAAGRTELYWVFAMPSAVLLLFELFLSLREFRRMRMTHRGVSP